MLRRNCALRRPGREPYGMEEYVQLLIRQDDAELQRQLMALTDKRCGKCGDRLPVAECCCKGDTACWVTAENQELKLSV